MKSYKKPSQEIWTGRITSNKEYLHEVVECLDLNNLLDTKVENGFALIGYCCDEGVTRNHGRAGAKDAPKKVRSLIARTSSNFANKNSFYDVGDIQCINNNLDEAQENLGNAVSTLLKKKLFPILIGGGHDIAWGHYLGIKKYFSSKGKSPRLGIINFDAHFDLRLLKNGPNSGTPFRQVAEDRQKEGLSFNYFCIGVNPANNTNELYESAYEMGCDFADIHNCMWQDREGVIHQVLDFINEVDCIYLSIDMDCFSSLYAPGVSAPNGFGLTPEVFFTILSSILQSKKTLSIDIAETNPQYDINNTTTRLVAQIIHFTLENKKYLLKK